MNDVTAATLLVIGQFPHPLRNNCGVSAIASSISSMSCRSGITVNRPRAVLWCGVNPEVESQIQVVHAVKDQRLPLSQTYGPSSSGKTIIVASTEGNVSIPDHEEKLGLIELMALLAISLRSGDRPQLGVELPSPDRHLGVESDPKATWVPGNIHHSTSGGRLDRISSESGRQLAAAGLTHALKISYLSPHSSDDVLMCAS